MCVQIVNDRAQVRYCRGDERIIDLSLRDGDIESFREGKIGGQSTVAESKQAKCDDDNNG